MFLAKPENYSLNVRQSATFAGKPAQLTTPTGEREPAVVLHGTGRVHGVLPVAAALRLANEIADAVEAAENAA